MLLASVLLAIVIAPPGDGDEGCPSSRQVGSALQARVAWAMLPPGQPAGPGTLRLAVAGTPGGVRVQLGDVSGEPVLVRTLPPPARGKAADCAALAETVALIVERYLHDVGYEAPPLPPGPPAAATVEQRAPPVPTTWPATPSASWRVGVGLEGRYGDTRDAEGAALLSLGYERAFGERRGGARLAAGVGPRTNAAFTDGDAALRRIPLRLGAYLGLRAGPGWVEPGLDAGVNLLLVSVSRGSSVAAQTDNGELRVAPFASVGLGYTLPLGSRLYLRALARGGAAVPYLFVATPERREVFSTPRTYLEVGLESGVAFP